MNGFSGTPEDLNILNEDWHNLNMFLKIYIRVSIVMLLFVFFISFIVCVLMSFFMGNLLIVIILIKVLRRFLASVKNDEFIIVCVQNFGKSVELRIPVTSFKVVK